MSEEEKIVWKVLGEDDSQKSLLIAADWFAEHPDADDRGAAEAGLRWFAFSGRRPRRVRWRGAVRYRITDATSWPRRKDSIPRFLFNEVGPGCRERGTYTFQALREVYRRVGLAVIKMRRALGLGRPLAEEPR